MERPDLTNASPQIRAYIEYLERRLKISSSLSESQAEPDIVDNTPLPSEQPTTFHVITSSRAGVAKRTLRHLYPRQHRGGMGIFDLDVSGTDYPAVISMADEDQNLLVFTSKARVYRHNLSRLEQTAVHSRGKDLFERTPMDEDESIAAILPEQAAGYVAILSAQGRVRTLRHHLFGEHMRPGTALYKHEEFGPLVSACWTPGDAELLIASRKGQAIRFNEKLINPQGDWGMKLAGDDAAVSIASVQPDGLVFLVSANGKGAVRSMSGFAPNKSTGGSGKIALKTDALAGMVSVEPDDELFLLSRLGKVIRFPANEVPVTDGAVQGVYCMGLRGDEVVTVLRVNSDHTR